MSTEKEQDYLSHKYADILFEINKKYRQEIRNLHERKNVIPTKYILPKAYISRLLEYPQFRRVWERKVLCLYALKVPRDDTEEEEREWFKVTSFPNLGGVLVEEGKELGVELERIPRRKRSKKDAN